VRLFDVLLGKPLPTQDEDEEKIGALRGIPLLGLDALSSAAYGPEALLTVLLPLGVAGLRYVLPLTLAIVAVLTTVFLSYRQIIPAYPNGGGSYVVAKENLGRGASLLAAAALGLDYTLNVAVGISAGVGAVVSAVPPLLHYTLPLCLGVLLVIIVVNLRGVRQSGTVFALPTYVFIASMLVIIGVGIGRAIAGAGVAHGAFSAATGMTGPTAATVGSHAPAAGVAAAASAWVLVRAFANGCSAMTGVESVSNAVPSFRAPAPTRARRTLAAIVLLLTVFLVGVAVLCRAYHVIATPPGQPGYQSILSQLAHVVFGRGVLYGVCMASIFAVLALSANTSFAGFPRVARLLARDRFLPVQYERRGRRLVFSHGILVLGLLSGLLLVAFRGVTDRLIPLFAIGALLAFTMAQAGMVVHWHKHGVHGPRLWTNAVGAVTTGITVLLVLASKFVEGAWMSVVIVLALIALFSRVRRHLDVIDLATRTSASLEIGPPRPPLAVVPIRRWDLLSLKALRFAVGFASEVVAVQVLTDDGVETGLSERWPQLVEAPARRIGVAPPRLVVLRSEYRQLFAPLLRFVSQLVETHADRQIAVIVPELVEPRWYHTFLHRHASEVLRALLLYRGGPQIVVVSAPWYLRDWLPERLGLLRGWGRRAPAAAAVSQANVVSSPAWSRRRTSAS
jgi:amino acid transporter